MVAGEKKRADVSTDSHTDRHSNWVSQAFCRVMIRAIRKVKHCPAMLGLYWLGRLHIYNDYLGQYCVIYCTCISF